MASPGRGGARRGAEFERRVIHWMNDHWDVGAKRVRSGRSLDDGDIVYHGSESLHIDCKSRDSIPLSMFHSVEADADRDRLVPVMIVDRPGTRDAGDAYVVVRLRDAQDLFL